MKKIKTFKKLLNQEDIVVAPGCYDPLSARIIEDLGFEALYLGGWAIGAHLGVSEPLVNLSEVTNLTNCVTNLVSIPLLVDANAGFGDATHMKRTIKVLEKAGASGVHIEDQVFPKKVGYHRGEIQLIPIEEMLYKIEVALSSRMDEDFIIIARTDAGRNKGESFDRAIERANIYAKKTMADMIMVFPREMKDVIRAPREIDAPLVYVNSEGLGRPILSPEELSKMGYKMVIYPITSVLISTGAIRDTFMRLKKMKNTGNNPEDMTSLAQYIMNLIRLPELYELEERRKKE